MTRKPDGSLRRLNRLWIATDGCALTARNASRFSSVPRVETPE